MQKIALIYPSGHLFQTPCLVSLAEQLGRTCAVDLFTMENSDLAREEIPNVSIRYYPQKLHGVWEAYSVKLIGYTSWLLWNLSKDRHDRYILLGERALITALFIKLMFRGRIDYNCLELYFREGFASPLRYRIYLCLKQLIVKCVDKLVIQDKRRARLFLALTPGDVSTVIFPNIPAERPMVEPATPTAVSGDSGGTRVLYAGSVFASWAKLAELVDVADHFPPGSRLIIHARMNVHDDNLRRASIKDNVIVSNSPLTTSEYEVLLRSIHIGLAFYETGANRNMKYVGLSSGKILHYLKAGKPIIVNRLPYWGTVISRSGIGVSVNSVDEIPKAILTIMKDYQEYSERARRYFMCIEKMALKQLSIAYGGGQ